MPALPTVRSLARSGWLPAALVSVVAVWLLSKDGDVDVVDIVAVAGWVLWMLTLPGTVVWRMVDARRSGSGPRARPFVEDLVLGTIAGTIGGIAAYLVAVAAGVPRLSLVWPLLVVVPVLATARGRTLLRQRQPLPTPVWWSWALAAAVLYVVVYSDRGFWVTDPMGKARVAPYVDEPYHLALAADFLHHFPAQVPFVAGTPLKYHWLFYPFAAAASWGTGVDLQVLVHLLLPVVLSGMLVLGVAIAGVRLSGQRLAGPAAILLLTAAAPLHLAGWRAATSPWVSTVWLVYRSPTQMIANALCPLLVVVLARMLRRPPLRRHWAAVFVVMLAVAGAKSAMLPLFIAGLAGTSVVMLVVRRRIPWVAGVLTVLSGIVFGIATLVFYGRGSRSVSFSPFQFADHSSGLLGLTPMHTVAAPAIRAAIAIAYVCLLVPSAIATTGAFGRGGWRRPVPWLLLGAWVAGVGVFLLFGHPSLAQAYFLESAIVPVTVLGAVGWARAIGTPTRRRALAVVGLLAAGLAWAWVVRAVVPGHAPNPVHPVRSVLTAFLPSVAVGLAGVVAAVTVVVVVRRRGGRPWLNPLAVAIALVLGMGLVVPVARVWGWRDGVPQAHWTQTVPTGGIAAAHWLRDHSDPDDLVATNMHTPYPGAPAADHRQFWLSALSERRVLVEGWAYIPPETVGLPSNARTNASGGAPFWKPRMLHTNDRLFTHATARDAATLRDRYGVDWIFADANRGVDLARLRTVAQERFHDGKFWVLRLDGTARG